MNIYKKNKTSTKVALMLFVVLMTSIFTFAGTASASTHYVNASGEANFTTIQAAINAADTYDTIIVLDGIYYENVEVNNSVSLFAAADDALIISNSSDASVINVTADDVIIDGFNVDANNTSSSGIFVLEADNITVQNNEVFNATIEDLPSAGKYNYNLGEEVRANYSLVVLFNCSNITVDNNILTDGFAGVGYISGENIYIINNEISEVNRGIKSCLDYNGYETGTGLYIMDNIISSIGDRGIEVMSDNSVISGNTIDNVSLVNVPFPDDYSVGGIFGITAGCSNHEIVNCKITDNTISNFYLDENDISVYRQSGIKTSYVDVLTISQNMVHSFYITNTSSAYRQEGISVHYGDEYLEIVSSIDSNTIEGLYVVNSSISHQYGLDIKDYYNVSVEDNTIRSLSIDNCSSANNNIRQSGIYGKYVYYSDFENNVVDDIKFTHPIDFNEGDKQSGLFIHDSEETAIIENSISNIYADYVGQQSGIRIVDSWDMTASENDITYLDIDNGNITENSYGKQIGILLCETDNSTLSDNTVEEVNTVVPRCMEAGVLVDDIDYATVTGNTIRNSNSTGLIIGGTYDSTFSENKISNCAEGGLFIDYSEGNLIYNNYFNNEVNIISDFESESMSTAFDAAPMDGDGLLYLYLNDWNIAKTAGTNIVGGPYLGGNYWVHPNGTGFSVDTADSNKDGICDEEYRLSEDEFDFLPLAPAPTEKKSSSGSRAYVGPSQPPEGVNSTDSSILRVTGGERMEYDFGNSSGPVLGISFDSKEDKGLVVGNVQVLDDAPVDVGDYPDGIPYEIMSITLGPSGTISDENADNIIINFRVSWEWINENNIDLSTIRLMRFHNGEWQELPTIQMNDDGEFLYFNAQTPGFSVFSIVGDEAGSDASVTAEDTTEVGSEEASTESTPGFTMLFSTALLAIAAVVIRRRN
ncbi:PGF-pre-PGF domain-containing protein [Methanococcoides sp. AM1]|uniref:PGF-pre-PGF domain-containing protein n=1 Tax=Methanococcoides sp. AM1 TaxID=1201011 RepID=UPI001082E78A|nr:PGF-pre-PGF domain-containing protein [Methanococcoides sp. AM1]